MIDKKVLLTERQLSEIYSFTIPWLRRNRALKLGIPFLKLGKNVRYRVEDVENYLNQFVVETK